jgi:endoglucanase Acf2
VFNKAIKMRIPFVALVVLIATSSSRSLAEEPIVRQGAGSYTTSLPAGAKAPPQTINCTETVTGKMPTNKWWSSLAWMKFSERHYPHPLAVEAEAKGLRLFYPGAKITANASGIFGFMPAKSADDLILGHSAQDEFPSAPVVLGQFGVEGQT